MTAAALLGLPSHPRPPYWCLFGCIQGAQPGPCLVFHCVHASSRRTAFAGGIRVRSECPSTWPKLRGLSYSRQMGGPRKHKMHAACFCSFQSN